MFNDQFSKFAQRLFVVLICASLFTIPSGCNSPDSQTAKPPTKKNRRPVPGTKRQIGLTGAAPAEEEKEEEPAAGLGETSSSESSSIANIEGGLPNGFFPQMTHSFAQTGFGGGLVPDFQNPASDADVNGGDNGPPPGAPGIGAGARGRGGFTSTNTPSQPDVASTPEGYMGAAMTAFQQRRESDAFKFLYAHILTDSTAQTDYPINWYSGISQPKVAFRMGVGVAYSAPKTFKGKPPVIGDPEDVRLDSTSGGRSSGRGGSIGAGGGAPGGGGGTAASPYGRVDTEQAEGFLLYYTGDFGDRFLTALEERRIGDEANYGAILKEVGVKYLEQPSSQPSRSAPPRRSGRGSIGPGGGGIGPGGGGAGLEGGGTPPPQRRANNRGRANNASSTDRLSRVSTGSAAVPDSELTGTLIPGVMLVGEGKKDELLERAKEAGLDALAVFSTRVSSGRKPKGSCVMRVYNVYTGEEIFKSRNLTHESVAKARDRNTGDKKDPVELAVRGVFNELLDTKFKATAIPENLKPEHVEGRVKQLMAKKVSDPLSTAVEIVSFQRMNLLNSKLAGDALDKIVGAGAGDAILSGDKSEIDSILSNYLPEASDEDEFR